MVTAAPDPGIDGIDVTADLAAELRRLRAVSGLSLGELQRLTHYSDSSLSRYFTGRTAPPGPRGSPAATTS